MTEKVLMLRPARVTQSTVTRKVKVVRVEVNGVLRGTYCSQGRRLNKRGIGCRYDGNATI